MFSCDVAPLFWMSPLFICACNGLKLYVALGLPTGVRLRVATADLCLVSLLCFHSTCNGIEHSSPSYHTINLVHICDVNT